MLTKDDLNALEALLDKKLEPIKADIEQIKEDAKETRGALNGLIEWFEELRADVDKIQR